MNPLINPHLSERIRGIYSEFLDGSFLSKILEDTIPVPFFGDYRDSSIATLSINPSSKEFYSQYKESAKDSLRGDAKRFVHLSEDLGLHPDFFRLGNRINDVQIIESIHESLLGYFSGPRSNWNKDWFKYPEIALNLGFDATYLSSASKKTAFHLDFSPWTTKAWRNLDESVKNELIAENRDFLLKFISDCKLSHLIVLGDTALAELKKAAKATEGASIEDRSDNVATKEPFGPRFERKSLIIGSSKITLYFCSFSPSARQSSENYSRKTTSSRDTTENRVALTFFYEEFGKFIAKAERKESSLT